MYFDSEKICLLLLETDFTTNSFSVPGQSPPPVVQTEAATSLLVSVTKPNGGNKIDTVEYWVDGALHVVTPFSDPVPLQNLTGLIKNSDILVSVRFCNFVCGELSTATTAHTCKLC